MLMDRNIVGLKLTFQVMRKKKVFYDNNTALSKLVFCLSIWSDICVYLRPWATQTNCVTSLSQKTIKKTIKKIDFDDAVK